jgi:hypothetical protein
MGIHLIDKNYTLENTLLGTQENMASIVAQNKLLQEQLDVLNQGQGEPWTLSEKIAWGIQKRSANALPFATGEPQPFQTRRRLTNLWLMGIFLCLSVAEEIETLQAGGSPRSTYTMLMIQCLPGGVHAG